MPQTFNVGSRSLFVTFTAWAFILMALLSVATALVQHASMVAQLPGWSVVGPVPLLAGLLAAYLPWLVGAGLLLSLATLAAAIGLLVRLEWARQLFIALLVLAMVANLVGIWLQQELLQALVDTTLKSSPLPQAAAGVFGGFVTATRAMAVAVSLGGVVLLGWTIRRLMSPAVRQEFA